MDFLFQQELDLIILDYNTTASFTFEFEDVAESGTITERFRVGTTPVISSDYSGQVAFGATFTASATGSGNEITLATAGQIKLELVLECPSVEQI